MSLVAKSFTDIPKREAPGRSVDLDEARQILDIISSKMADGTPQTATDDIEHDDVKKARSLSNKYKRLVERVVPDGMTVKTRVYESGKGFRWAIYLAADKKASKDAATVDEKKPDEKPAEKPAK